MWRLLFPSTKGYTFFSHLHQRYSRIDYLFISNSEISALESPSVENMLISDHHPIMMSLVIANCVPRYKIWRFNPSIVYDPVIKAEEELKSYFCTHYTEDVSVLNVWAAHKCVLRDKLLGITSKQKKGFIKST